MKTLIKLIRHGMITGLVLFLLLPNNALGSNYVKIATVGAPPVHLDLDQEPQLLVDQVIEFWENELSRVLPDKPDLIVLPEACDRPAGMNIDLQLKYFKARGEQVLQFFSSVARDNQCYIAFGAKHQLDDGSWRNSCFLIDRTGKTAGIYNKNFPTIGEMEAGIKAGKEAPVFECDFGRVACAICFDLNFDELRQRYAEQKPDIIVFPSMYHGGLVQEHWAYTCRSYFVSAIAIASLCSEIRNPMGKIVATSTNYFHTAVATVNLDYCLAHLDYNWAKLSAMKEKYGEDVTISDPSEIGSVLLTSEHETIGIDEMVKEFEITLLDEYLKNSRAFRHKPGMME